MSVADIETAHVMKVIEPIWLTKPETASRVRGRIEAVLGWATVSGYRRGENPARWHDHLDNLLPAMGKVRAVKHQTSLPLCGYASVHGGVVQQARNGCTGSRIRDLDVRAHADVHNAKHADGDPAAKMWVVPALSQNWRRASGSTLNGGTGRVRQGPLSRRRNWRQG